MPYVSVIFQRICTYQVVVSPVVVIITIAVVTTVVIVSIFLVTVGHIRAIVLKIEKFIDYNTRIKRILV